MFNTYRKSSLSSLKTSGFSLVFPLVNGDATKNDVASANGEIAVCNGMTMDSGVSLPNGDYDSGVRDYNEIAGATISAQIEFALGRSAPTAGVADEAYPPYSFRAQCDYDAVDLLGGNAGRTDAIAAAEIQSSFASKAFPMIDNLRSSAAGRNLLSGAIRAIAAWRLESGEYFFTSPPVLLVSDEEEVQFSITSVADVDGGFAVAGNIIQRFCRLFCRISSVQSLPAEIVGCDIFLTPPDLPRSDSKTGEFGTIKTSGCSYSGKINVDGSLSEVYPTPVNAALSRTRGWRPKALDDKRSVALPSDLRLVARIERSQFALYSSFREPEYIMQGLKQTLYSSDARNIQRLTPDYSVYHPIVSSSSVSVGLRNIIFNASREYWHGFSRRQMASFRSSDPSERVATRVLVGIRTLTDEFYLPLENNLTVTANDLSPLGTSCFYPDSDAFELVVESNGKRYRMPLRADSVLGGSLRTCFDPMTTEPATTPFNGTIRSSRAITDDDKTLLRISSIGLKNFFPGHLTTSAGECGEIIGLGFMPRSSSTFIVLGSQKVVMMRLNANGTCSLPVEIDSSGSLNGTLLIADKYIIYPGINGIRLFDGSTVKSLGVYSEFGRVELRDTGLVTSLPEAAALISAHCGNTLPKPGSQGVLLKYSPANGMLVATTESGDLFILSLSGGRWQYAGNERGESAPGYLITRPMSVDRKGTLAVLSSVRMLAPGEKPSSVLALYFSADMQNWFLGGHCNGSLLHLTGAQPGRFWRVLYIGKEIPAGVMLSGKCLKGG